MSGAKENRSEPRRGPLKLALVAGPLMALTLAAGASTATRGSPGAGAQAPAPVSLGAGVALPPAGPAKLDYRLWRLEELYRDAGLGPARDFAEQQGIRFRDGRVRLLIHENANPFDAGGGQAAGPDDADEALFAALESIIRERVEGLGGAVAGRTLHLIEAELPPGNLQALTGGAEVAWVEPSPRPYPDSVVSQGVRVVGAEELQRSPARHFPSPEPVRVGVLDTGFLGADALLSSDLPTAVVSRSFHPGGISAAGAPSAERQHGTAVAEIVFDMAPGAELFLTNVDSVFGHSQATSWLLSHGVQVINNSLSWFNLGPGDGRGPINFDVQRAVSAGAKWVVSAGNQQERHWEGTFNDPDGDGWHNFSGAAETNPVRLPADGSLTLFLSWDDWFSSDQNYDLFIFFECSDAPGSIYPCTGTGQLPPPATSPPIRLEGASRNAQSGEQPPVEQARVQALGEPVVAHVAIRRVAATRNVRLEAFFVGELEAPPAFLVREGSITIPADTEVALTVGATFWADDRLEPSSSLGPTSDGRIKPDLAAPATVDTVSFGPLGFPGTSAAAPHVSGAIALVKARFGLYTPDEIITILLGRALDKGDPGKDNRFGAGRLELRGVR